MTKKKDEVAPVHPPVAFLTANLDTTELGGPHPAVQVQSLVAHSVASVEAANEANPNVIVVDSETGELISAAKRYEQQKEAKTFEKDDDDVVDVHDPSGSTKVDPDGPVAEALAAVAEAVKDENDKAQDVAQENADAALKDFQDATKDLEDKAADDAAKDDKKK